MSNILFCAYCDKEFTPTHGHQKRYCSLSCCYKFNGIKWRMKNPSSLYHQKKRYNLKKFGLTIETYNEIFNKQEGCCAICKTHQSDLKRNLAVDHNHKTGENRGLLCQKCNQGIGLLNDDPVIIASALEYVS